MLGSSAYEPIDDARPWRRRALVGVVALVAFAGAALGTHRITPEEWSARMMRDATTAQTATATATATETALYSPAVAAAEYAVDRAACANYDDDYAASQADWDCTQSDFSAWCSKEHLVGNTTLMRTASSFYQYCSAGCAHENRSWAMLCAWEVISALPSACAGTFAPSKPGDSMNRNNTFDASAAPRAVDLYHCDEHSFCHACSTGNAYCNAVASYYGGVGSPLRVSYKSLVNFSADGYISATSAMHALMLDMDYWCKPHTLAQIDAGAFDARFTPASSPHAGKFGAGKKSWEIGGLSWSDIHHIQDTERWDDNYTVGDDLVQQNWPGLVCADDDDDKWDWGAPHSVMHCVGGDSYTCLSYAHDEALWNVCSDTCNTTDEALIAAAEVTAAEQGGQWSQYANPSMVGHSWLVPCAWEAIADLPRLCNDTFTATLPIGASNNLDPVVSYESHAPGLNISGVIWDACNVHAFCYACDDADGSLNPYCEAVLQKYSQYPGSTPSDAKTNVFKYLDKYWCRDEVLGAIADGSYRDKLVAGSL